MRALNVLPRLLVPVLIVAFASCTEPPDAGGFGALDINGDGFIELGEWVAAGGDSASFAAQDSNGDGQLSLSEYDTGNSGEEFSVAQIANITVNPTEVTFIAGVAETREIIVSNTGGGVLTLTSISTKLGAAAYTVDMPSSMVVAPSGQVTILVHFTPTTALEDDVLVIEHNAPDAPTRQIPLLVADVQAKAAVIPSMLTFGDVLKGETHTLPFVIKNLTALPVSVSAMHWLEESSTDFAFAEEWETPFTIEGDGALQVAVNYTPSTNGGGIGYVRIVTGQKQDEEILLPVTGNVLGPKALAIPAILAFGDVPIGMSHSKPLEIRNGGTQDLIVENVVPTIGTPPAIAAIDVPVDPVTLGPGESTFVTVEFAPTEPIPYTLAALGGVTIVSNDDNLVVPTYGNVASPDLIVDPTSVNFGPVALNNTRTEEVYLLNAGKDALNIESISVPTNSNGEFEFVGFDPATWTTPGILLPDESVLAIVSFTNSAGSSGSASGELLIESTDPLEPQLLIPLQASRVGLAECKIALSPETLNFGIVPHGNTKTLPVNVHNIGAGPCTWSAAQTYDCTSFFGLLGGCSEGFGGSSKHFKVLAQPIPVPGGLAPTEKVTVHVTFIPPADAPILGDFFDSYTGALQVSVLDTGNGNALVQEPVAASAEDLDVNLIAQSGISDISVIPGSVDFGLISIGNGGADCTSPATKITIYNNGNAPLSLGGITLQDCTPEFSLLDVPPIPPGGLEVNQNNPVDFKVLYNPQIAETSYCTVSIESTDADQPLLTVPLEGTGTWDTENTDHFTQLSGKLVDILFVVDDSGSMSAEQQNLADNFQALIQEANTWGSDYQLGVITTDVENDGMKGKLQGNPKFVTPGPGAESQFINNVKVGDSGMGSQESGLEAAHMALSLPNLYNGTTPCTNNSECESLGDIQCIAGACTGANTGFIREDAALELVFISDEEDQSSGPLSFYIDFFKSIKGFANESMMHAHSIVGTSGDTCEADVGNRYIEVATQTGGKVGSICATNFAAVLASIGDVAFGLKVQFFLSAVAEAPTVQVWVNGQECTTGWVYDAPTNSVIFDENGACMPQEGEGIDVAYKMLCLQDGP